MEGEFSGKRYSRALLTYEEEKVAMAPLVEKKARNEFVGRTEIVTLATEKWSESHAHRTRHTQFKGSPRFISGLRRRQHLVPSRHRIRKTPPATPQQLNQRIDDMAEYLMHVEDAVTRLGADRVINVDETFAHAIQHPSTSTHVVGQPNNVNSTSDERHGITTMPAVTASGRHLPLQVLATGKTHRAANSLHLPTGVVGDHTKSGWQTSDSPGRYIDVQIAAFTHDEPSALILDKYKAHCTAEVYETAAQHDIELIFVPAGLTGLLQPLDVHGMLQLKDDARRQWIEAKVAGKENVDTRSAAAGRMSEAYDRLPASTIQHAFERAVPELGHSRQPR